MFFTKPFISFVWVSLVFAGSLYLTVTRDEPLWISRSGGMITLAGLLLTTRKLILYEFEELVKSQTEIDGRIYGDPEEEKKQFDALEELKKDIKSERCGFWYLLIGTICWGYGDILYNCIISIIHYVFCQNNLP